jgi:hypothetical protein
MFTTPYLVCSDAIAAGPADCFSKASHIVYYVIEMLHFVISNQINSINFTYKQTFFFFKFNWKCFVSFYILFTFCESNVFAATRKSISLCLGVYIDRYRLGWPTQITGNSGSFVSCIPYYIEIVIGKTWQKVITNHLCFVRQSCC